MENLFSRRTLLGALTGTAVCSCPALAQVQVRKPEATGVEALAQLKAELLRGDAKSCSREEQLHAGVRSIEWLSNRFAQVDASEIPEEYSQGLQQLTTSLRMASVSSDPQLRCRVLDFVLRDVTAKHEDCRTFGHARGKVKVEIRTLHNGLPQPNWEVYVVWLPDGDRFTGVPRRLESLSTPAKGNVPFPGEFLVFAKHPESQRTTPQQQISVKSSDPFTWSITVPMITAPSLRGQAR